MKHNKCYLIFILPLLLLLLLGCSASPKAIDYGNDGCKHCKMTIVDEQHAAEIVTKKGKVYKFDATECMVYFLNELDVSEIKLYLSNNYAEPKTLIDATQATFLISENIPSPMGAYLSAFSSKEAAQKVKEAKGGDIYTWGELLAHLKK